MQDFKLPSLDTSKIVLLIGKLLRTKRADVSIGIEPGAKLEKCLKTRDLISLGVGSCVGTGMYLVAGMVARNVAGPAVIFSFMIAALASLFSGVCYAEFGVRVPNTSGSAYMYSYVTVGEFVAFVIGWNMILEYMIGTAAGAAAISACIDAMYGGSIRLWSKSVFGTFFGHVPNALAALITLMMSVLLAAGVKKSIMFNNILNLVNFAVWLFIVVASLFYIDFDNWSKHGGFTPYGWSGVLDGAATCFYAFIGFDIIATTGEEAENPQRSIPTAIVSSLAIVLVAYVSCGLMVTLIVPYTEIDAGSSLVEMFTYVHADRCKMIAAVGALAGLVVSMFGSFFPMPRVLYAISSDGLLFRELSELSPFTNTPVKATFIFGSITAFIAFIMSLEVLVEMMSIGTLMAYTLVSACVLLLRYQPTKTNLVELLPQSIRSACPTPSKEYAPAPIGGQNAPQFVPYVSRQQQFSNAKRTNAWESSESDDTDPNWSRQGSKDDEFLVPGTASLHYGSVPYQHGGSSSRRSGILDKYEKLLMYLFPYGWKVNTPATDESGMYVVRLVGIFLALVVTFDILLAWHLNSIEWENHILFLSFYALMLMIVAIILAISRQPQIRCNLKFKAPGVPFVPAIAIIINIYLIFRLSILTLVRFAIWMSIGLFIYFGYGIDHSTAEMSAEQQQQQQTNTTSLAAARPFNGTFREPISQQPIELKIPNSRIMANTTTAKAASSATIAAATEVAKSETTWNDSKPKPPPIPPRPSLRALQSHSISSQQRSLHQYSTESFDSKNKWETFE